NLRHDRPGTQTAPIPYDPAGHLSNIKMGGQPALPARTSWGRWMTSGSALVGRFAVRDDVQALALVLVAHAQADRRAGDEHGHCGDDRAPQDGEQPAEGLRPDLRTDRHLDAGAAQ